MLEKQLKSLKELAAAKPALADVCEFHNALCRLVSGAGPFLGITVEDTTATQLLDQGFPMLSAAKVEIDKEALKTFFADLLKMLHEHGQQGQEELKLLQKSIQENDLDLECLLQASLDRDHTPIKKAAEKVGVETALLEFCLNTTLGAALQNCLSEGLLRPEKDWNHGYCPICGSLPSIAELSGDEGKKHLLCSLCGYSWAFHRLTCVNCGNNDHKTLEYFTSEEDPGYRVDICRKCNSYLKVVDRRERGDGLMLVVEDVATLHLDLLAAKEGFSRCKKASPPS